MVKLFYLIESQHILASLGTYLQIFFEIKYSKTKTEEHTKQMN